MPSTPKPDSASLTSSSLKGLMMASIFFMSFFRVAEPDTNTQWSAVNRNVKKNKKFSSRFLREFFASTFPWFARHPPYTAPDESGSRRCVPEPAEKCKLPPGRSPAWLLKLISWPVGFFAALWPGGAPWLFLCRRFQPPRGRSLCPRAAQMESRLAAAHAGKSWLRLALRLPVPPIPVTASAEIALLFAAPFHPAAESCVWFALENPSGSRELPGCTRLRPPFNPLNSFNAVNFSVLRLRLRW